MASTSRLTNFRLAADLRPFSPAAVGSSLLRAAFQQQYYSPASPHFQRRRRAEAYSRGSPRAQCQAAAARRRSTCHTLAQARPATTGAGATTSRRMAAACRRSPKLATTYRYAAPELQTMAKPWLTFLDGHAGTRPLGASHIRGRAGFQRTGYESDGSFSPIYCHVNFSIAADLRAIFARLVNYHYYFAAHFSIILFSPHAAGFSTKSASFAPAPARHARHTAQPTPLDRPLFRHAQLPFAMSKIRH